jgi:hypothetical protein
MKNKKTDNFNTSFRTALFILLFLISALCYAQQEQEENITVFRSIFKLRLSADYKFMFFVQPASYSMYQTTRPLDLGIGFSIFGFTLGISFSVPIQHPQESSDAFSLDINFNNYWRDNSYTYGYIKYNSDFYSNDKDDIGLSIFHTGISHEVILNKNHSIRSAYILDRKQSVSNGSFLIGGGIFYTVIRSDSVYNEDDKLKLIYFGPNFGYSYNWIIKENFFINVLSVFGVDLLINDGKISYALQALPRISAGYHGNTWSANVYGHFPNLIVYPGNKTEFNLISGNIGTLFVKRF